MKDSIEIHTIFGYEFQDCCRLWTQNRTDGVASYLALTNIHETISSVYNTSASFIIFPFFR